MSIAMCTIVSKNYIPLARTLVNSYLEHHPNGKAFVLLVDNINGEIEIQQEKFELVELEQIGIPRLDYFCFKYNITELNTAVKPYFLEYLLNTFKINKLIYFDPDILIMRSLHQVYQILDSFNIVITPHIVSPISDDNLKPSEIDLLRAGAYNLGFIGLTKNEIVLNFLRWWKERLYKYCVIDINKGFFVDQKWIDLVPGMYNGTYILRDVSFNAAYWNLHERKINYINGTYNVNNKPLVFYHFSGFNINLQQISKHQNRFSWKDVSDLYSLFALYKQKVISNGYMETKDLKYSFGFFNNGMRILDVFRQVYRNFDEDAFRFGNPFDASLKNSFYHWLLSPVNNTKVPKFLYEIYKIRPDLQKVFPDVLGRNQERLIQWAKVSLQREYGIEGKFLNKYPK